MAEQPNHGQPNQQPYPYGQPQVQQPFPPQQQGRQGQPQPPYQNAYQPSGQQPPYPQQQYGAPQSYPPAHPQQPYPQVPPQQNQGQQHYVGQAPQPYGQPQQSQGQQFPGQQPYGYPQQAPGQPLPQDPAQSENQPKPKKKRSRWATFFIVIFSPFIALAFVLYGIYWVLAWLLTPVALVLHFVFCGIGLIWYSGVKVLASGRSKYRLFQPMYPKFPPFWTGAYWVRLNRNVRSTFEGLAAVAQLLDW